MRRTGSCCCHVRSLTVSRRRRPRCRERAVTIRSGWTRAAVEGKTQSPFEYAAVLTESLLLGNVALRTGQPVEWDAAQMRVTNNSNAEAFITPEFRKGWHF